MKSLLFARNARAAIPLSLIHIYAQDKEAITTALDKAFPVLDNAPFSEETIGQSMGYDTLITSAWSLFFGILGIMVYLTVIYPEVFRTISRKINKRKMSGFRLLQNKGSTFTELINKNRNN